MRTKYVSPKQSPSLNNLQTKSLGFSKPCLFRFHLLSLQWCFSMKLCCFFFESNHAPFIFPCHSGSKYLLSDVSALRQICSSLKHLLLFSHPLCRFLTLSLSYCPSLNFMPWHTQLREEVLSLSAFFVRVVCFKCKLCQYHLLLYSCTGLTFPFVSRCHCKNKSQRVLEVLCRRKKDLCFRDKNNF